MDESRAGAITRRRTGCAVCRKRRVRCDEAKPSCTNCIRNSQSCTWINELRFVHKTSTDAGQKHSTNAAELPRPPKQLRRSIRSHGFRQVKSPLFSPGSARDESNIVRGQPKLLGSSSSFPQSPAVLLERSLLSPTTNFGGPVEDESSDLASPPNLSATEICRSESAKLRQFIETEHASPIPPNLNPNPEGFTNWHNLGVSDALLETLTSHGEVELLNNYIWECAPWFDVHNSKRNFSKTDVPRMMNCPPWRAAALALSAKNLELRDGKPTDSRSLSLHLYQLAVRLAIDSISGRFDCVGTLAGCVLLTVYDMMTVSYIDWRRHLQGCASIYTHNNWNGSTGGLISASFWDYARIDIWAAFCSGTKTLTDPCIWFDEPDCIMSLTDVDEDIHAQIATWLLGRTVNLVCSRMSPSLGSPQIELEDLRENLSKWETIGSTACRAVTSRDSGLEDDTPFPQILFASHSSIIAHTMFHTAMVLVLELEQSKSLSSSLENSDAIYQHSRIACGIVETNKHTACLVNSLQPIWICGRHLRTKAERFAVLEILARIEKTTGWKCDWRSRELKNFWDLC